MIVGYVATILFDEVMSSETSVPCTFRVKRYISWIRSCRSAEVSVNSITRCHNRVSFSGDTEPMNPEFPDEHLGRRQSRIVSPFSWFGVDFWHRASCPRKWIRCRLPQNPRQFLLRNFVALAVATITGIITFESSVEVLRNSLGATVLFPVYLPRALALAISAHYETSVLLGNLFGFLASRIYSAWRGSYIITVTRGGVFFCASFFEALEISTATFFLRNWLCHGSSGSPTIESIRDALLYVSTVFLSSFFFDTIIAVVICVSPLVSWSEFYRFWGASWLGVLAGMLTITPAAMHVLVWKLRPALLRPRIICEALGVMVLTGALVGTIFFADVQTVIHPLPYLLFPLIILSAFRFNRLGGAVIVLIITYLCSWTSIRGQGALYRMAGSPSSLASPRLIVQVELFVSVLGLVGILLAAAVREKKQLARDLHIMNEELESTVIQRTQELVKANDELKTSQRRAEEASQAKSEFLANMSHEIRTPIHGIMGLTELLLDSELSEDQRESLLSAKECADLLLHIINSILDLAKIEAGRVEVERVPFSVRQLVNSTVRMLTSPAQERQLDLLWEVDSSVPDWLVGDCGKIQQCLLNLVGNAVKFTHKGSVTVEVTVDRSCGTQRNALVGQDLDYESQSTVYRQNVALVNQSGGFSPKLTPNIPEEKADCAVISIFEKPLECQSGPAKAEILSGCKSGSGTALSQELLLSVPVIFKVRDTGIGISKEKLQDIFTPFTQADASTSRVYGGTGLGLCIVQRFAELLGGNLVAESDPGKGSVFRFCIPLRPSSTQNNLPRMNIKDSRETPKLSQPSRYCDGEQMETGGSGVTRPFKGGGEMKDQLHRDLVPEQKLVHIGEEETSGSCRLTADSRSDNCSSSVIDTIVDVQVDAPVSSTPLLTMALMEKGSPALGERKEILTEGSGTDVKGSSRWHARWGDSSVTQLKRLDPESGHDLQQPAKKSLSPAEDAFPDGAATVQSDIFCKDGEKHKDPIPCVLSDVHLPTFLAPADRKMPQFGESRTRHHTVHDSAPVSQKNVSRIGYSDQMKLHLNVLLVEDNLINQKVASRQLQKHGHTVTIVGDGLHAVDFFRAHHDTFDLVLMDVQMPMMDGLEATRTIRTEEAQRGWRRVPILGLTAHAIQGYEQVCLSSGMDGYLGKPFDIKQLLVAMDKYLPVVEIPSNKLTEGSATAGSIAIIT